MNSKSKNIGLFNYRKYPTRMKLGKIDRVKMLENPKQKDVVFTPEEVVDDMLDLIPQYIWSDPNSTFLDPCCKSGIFLERIYWRLYEGLSEKIPDRVDRNNHILEKQLFGLSQYDKTADDSRSVLYGTTKANHKNAYTRLFDTEHGNILTLKIEDDKRAYYFEQIVGDETRNLVKEVMRKGFGEEMKFDVVIGNPPYNRGMDLDFVNLGFDLCKKYCVMITPAKWQTAADDYRGCASKTIDYKGFREKLVPHMSKVVFYPDCLDIFEIAQNDGITYYILDKNKEKDEECVVENRCIRQEYFNSIETRTINNRETLHNIGNKIIEYLGKYRKFNYYNSTIIKSYYVATTALFSNSLGQGGSYDWDAGKIRVGSAGEGGLLLTKKGNVQVLSGSEIRDKNKSLPTSKKITFSSDSYSECSSFISYIYTKFVRFFLLINESQMNNAVKPDWFRFVPAPPAQQVNPNANPWDHIYTDEELYKAFNLPQKYIDVIEAVIKERK